MTVSSRVSFSPVIAVGCGAVAAVLGAGGSAEMSLWLAVLASVAVVALALSSSGGFNTLLVVFAVFHALYGLSGSFASVYGAPLQPIYTEPYETSRFLFNYSLATIGLALGILLLRPGRVADLTAGDWRRSPRLLAQYSIVLGGVASAMEVINLIRVGGVPVLLEGKALYQSLTAELPMNLPSEEVAMLAAAIMALAVGASRGPSWARSARVSRLYMMVFALTLLPLLAVAVWLGQRGLLLGWVLIALVGVTYSVSIRRITFGMGSLALVVYLGMGVIYASRGSRGAALYSGDWSAILKNTLARQAVLQAINPASNEFGATLGNFSEYLKTGTQAPGLGRSYLVSLVLPIPSSLYPGRKPQQIGYEFRDLVFPAEAERGSIAGTGYSSILEAYYNFREVGVLVVYALMGMVLVTVERYRTRSPSLWFAVIYLMFLPSAVTFHRTAFGDAVVAPAVLNGAAVLLLWVVSSVIERALVPAKRTA